MKVKVLIVQLCPTLCNPMDYSPPGSSSPGKNVAISFSSRSSQPRDQTWVFCIAGRFFTIRATREVHLYIYTHRFLT